MHERLTEWPIRHPTLGTIAGVNGFVITIVTTGDYVKRYAFVC